MTFEDTRIVSLTAKLPKNLYDKFKVKIKEDGFSINEAIESLMYMYVNNVRKGD